MKKATDALLSDHKMIRKLLTGLTLDNPRFGEVSKTAQRVILTHAWFEDQIFLPAFKNEPLFAKRYLDELYNEHQDIDYFLKLLRTEPPAPPKQLEAMFQQFRAVLENHLKKEEDALFPLAEKVLNNEGLNKLGAEMERRQKECAKLILDQLSPKK